MVTSWEASSSTCYFHKTHYGPHAFGLVARIYEPVEEHRRAALNALMGSADTRNRSQSLPLSDTPREGLAERGDTTQDGAGGAPTFPPDTDPETRAMLNKFAELIHKANMTKIAEASSEPRIPSPTQTQQAGPSRISESPFSQYSIHPDSPEPSDRNSSPVTADFKTSALLSPSSRPSRKTRPFKTSASSQGKTIWMTTASYEDISNPPEPDPEDEPGTLYIHRNLSGNTLQVWLLGNEKEWATVQFGIKTQHPTFSDRYLAVRLDGTPNWLTLASWYSAKKWVNSR